jgi:hypothetical protein
VRLWPSETFQRQAAVARPFQASRARSMEKAAAVSMHSQRRELASHRPPASPTEASWAPCSPSQFYAMEKSS